MGPFSLFLCFFTGEEKACHQLALKAHLENNEQAWLGLAWRKWQHWLHALCTDKITRALHATAKACRSTQTLGQTMIHTIAILLISLDHSSSKRNFFQGFYISPHHYDTHASFHIMATNSDNSFQVLNYLTFSFQNKNYFGKSKRSWDLWI